MKITFEIDPETQQVTPARAESKPAPAPEAAPKASVEPPASPAEKQQPKPEPKANFAPAKPSADTQSKPEEKPQPAASGHSFDRPDFTNDILDVNKGKPGFFQYQPPKEAR